jgi:hypothetical protein
VTPDAPRRLLGTLALAAAALVLAGLLTCALALALDRLGWFAERDRRTFLVGTDTDRTGRVPRLERPGPGELVLVLVMVGRHFSRPTPPPAFHPVPLPTAASNTSAAAGFSAQRVNKRLLVRAG